jgi:glutamate dehydrogenase/leucine dehydrogenase
VAQYTVEKVNSLGGTVVTLSDSDGTIVDEAGIDREKLDWVMNLKNVRRARIREYSAEFKGSRFLPGKRPWGVKCDVAFPSACQNEIDASDARTLIKNGCVAVAEGANMPTVPEGVAIFLKARILYAPGKAANAGGVATSGLEMSQNSQRTQWTREEVDRQLQSIMRSIHATCLKYGREGKFVNYVKGANIGGFVKVADAMLEQGLV